MKTNYKVLVLCSLIPVMTGCKDFLNEPVYTQPTTEYLTESVDGLAATVVSMYYEDRAIFRNGDDTDGEVYYITLIGDDITYVRAGGGIPQFGRYNELRSDNGNVRKYWQYQYQMIGLANTVINAGDKMDDQSEKLAQTLGEARCFRAHAYLRLLQRFDNIYITTETITPENLNEERHYAPAKAEDVYALITSDLTKAIEELPTTTTDQGRFTRGAARHILARAAAYMNDWTVVAEQVDSIEASGVYSLKATPAEVFDGSNLNHSEAILVSQWDKSTGGWFVNTKVDPITYNGHRMSIVFWPRYNQENGLMLAMSHGGYAWGRIFPNQHLLDLYDKAGDLRYEQYYRHYWTYNAPQLPRGKHQGDTVFASNTAQYQNVHPATTKYLDVTTVTDPSETSCFKDVIIYRLAESYLLGCEANIHLGNQDRARYYYNKTYTRAGNTAETGDITIEMFLDEHARELAMEGDRWTCLKREGKLGEYVRKFGGEFVKNEKNQVLMNDTAIRTNYQDRYVRWPIPLTQIELMAQDNYPQNEGY